MSVRMPWGKFKDRDIEDVPSGYLRWLAENCEDELICCAADEEFRWRGDNGTHWYEEFNSED